jgi:hypothetical protein
MLKTNKDKLVVISVLGEVAAPRVRTPYRITHEGEPKVFPGTGGITYNIKVGDLALGWVGDHIEPGVSMRNLNEKDYENPGLNLYACIGNSALVVSGDAKGAKGFVTGKHGGIEHVLCWFDQPTLEKLVIGDKIQIRACGQGLALDDLPAVKFYNLDPALFEKMGLMLEAGVTPEAGVLEFPVTHIIPPELMGSGLGSVSAASGDYDITTQDEESIKRLGLDKLRFGDVVFLADTDNSFGRCFKRGATTVGVVVHSNCVIAGHGPGVTTIATSAKGAIKPIINKDANIARYLNL